MLSLAERHEARAQRKADNQAEPIGGTVESIGTVTNAFRSFVEAYNRLNDEQKAEFDATAENLKSEFDGYRSLAESPDGSGTTMAGIGVINTKVVPASTLTGQEGNGGGGQVGQNDGTGWGAPADATPLSEGSNANGQALIDQGVVTAEDGKKAAKAAKTPADESK